MITVREIVAALVLAALPAVDAAACVKTVRWYDDAPFSFRNAGGHIVGFDADLAREALRRAGCQPRFIQMPWARALVELEAGTLDILPGSFRSAQRERYAYFSIPALQSPNMLYLGPGVAARYPVSRLDDLLGTPFRLGAQIGVSYGDTFDTLKADPRFQANLVPVTLRRNAWKMLEMGRIDGLIADPESAALELRDLGLEQLLRPSGVVVSTNTAMFAFSKRSVAPEFVERFNRALEAMITDGQYRTIRGRYLSCPPGAKILGCK